MKKIIYSALILTALIFLLIWPFFLKVNVTCKSQYGECDPVLQKEIGGFSGKSLFNAKRGVDKSLKTNFLISDYSLQFKLPDILEANVLIKKPQFALFDKNSGNNALINADGDVLAITKSSTLPKVVVSENFPKPGEKVSESDLFALKLVSGVFEMYQVGSGEIQNNSLVVDLPAQIRVIFPLEGDSQVLLGALRLIYTKIQGDLTGKFSQIDLRYKNPVLR